jgi:hypothetical protein
VRESNRISREKSFLMTSRKYIHWEKDTIKKVRRKVFNLKLMDDSNPTSMVCLSCEGSKGRITEWTHLLVASCLSGFQIRFNLYSDELLLSKHKHLSSLMEKKLRIYSCSEQKQVGKIL